MSFDPIESLWRMVVSLFLARRHIFFREKRTLAQYRQRKTLCVFVRARRGSSSAVRTVDPRGDADK